MESPLNHDDEFEDNLFTMLSYFVIIFISAYFFLTCGENPGWVKLPESEDTSLEKRNISTKYHPPFEYQKNEEILRNLDEAKHSFKTNSLESNDDLKEVIEMHNMGEEVHLEFANNKNDGPPRNSGSESSESFNDAFSVFSVPPKHYCKTCNIEQEYRTRHCHKCQKCVHKYDHHCFWIGGNFIVSLN